MQTSATEIISLRTGDRLSREEFIRHAEALRLKRAELIGGRVYIMSPALRSHSRSEGHINGCLMVYASRTPGCEANPNATCYIGDDAPLPDGCLRILEEFGGASRVGAHGFIEGSPELLAEVCETSINYDLHDKLELYRKGGIQEYIALLLSRGELRWHKLVGGSFQVTARPADGIYRSDVFPGLWIDSVAILAGDATKLLNTLEAGLASPEHAAFASLLQSRKRAQ